MLDGQRLERFPHGHELLLDLVGGRRRGHGGNQCGSRQLQSGQSARARKPLWRGGRDEQTEEIEREKERQRESEREREREREREQRERERIIGRRIKELRQYVCIVRQAW